MPESTAEMAGALSRATSGADTPNALRVRRPTTLAQWCQVGVLMQLGMIAAAIVYVLAFHRLPVPDGPDSGARLHWLGWIGLTCVVVMGAVALSQFFSRVDASAGPGSIHLGGGE